MTQLARPRPAAATVGRRDARIEQYLPMVRHVVARLPVARPAFLDLEDLHGAGVLGLIRAAETWDPNGGASFKTFAYTAIRGAVLDELRHHDPVPRARRARLRDLDAAAAALHAAHDRPPTLEELADHLGIPAADLDDDLELAHRCRTLSFDHHDDASDAAPAPPSLLAAALTDRSNPDPEAAAVDAERAERLAAAIAALPEQERRVVVLYHLEELYLKEIGELLGVTESRVSQILSRATARLQLATRERDGD